MYQDDLYSVNDVGIFQNAVCGLVPTKDYTPLVGNLDSDPSTEILWVDTRQGLHVIWWDLDSMWDLGGSPMCEPHEFMQKPADLIQVGVKPFVGDFDGNGVDDVFWYSPNTATPDYVWLFSDEVDPDDPGTILAHVVTPVTLTTGDVPGDPSPYVADLNADGKEDIFWYATTVERLDGSEGSGESVVWESVGQGSFVDRGPFVHPLDSYPVGYGPTRGKG